jgi:hypothetical protein
MRVIGTTFILQVCICVTTKENVMQHCWYINQSCHMTSIAIIIELSVDHNRIWNKYFENKIKLTM